MLTHVALPDVRSHRRFVAAVVLDAIGSGVFMPVAMLYFVRTTDVPLARVGLALSLAAFVAVPVTLFLGQLVDRFGPKRMLLAANAISFIGFLLYGFATSFAAILVVVALTAIGMAGFWASFGPLVAAISSEGEREKWFGFLGSLRNLGFAAGGLICGVILAVGTDLAYHIVVWANAASLAASFLLILSMPGGDAQERHAQAPTTSWRVVLSDAPYGLFVLVATVYALGCLALNFAMPVYVAERLHLPGWVAGAYFVINTVLVGFGQPVVVARLAGRRRYRIIETSFVVYALGFILMATAGWLPTGAAVVVTLVAAVVYTGGELLGGPVLTTVAAEARPASMRGRYMAYHQMAWQVANVVAPGAFAALLARGQLTIWVTLIALMAVGVMMAAALASRLPVVTERVTNSAVPQGD